MAIGLSSSGGGQFDLAAGQAGKGTVRGAYSENGNNRQMRLRR